MKTKLFFLLLTTYFLLSPCTAQVPQGFNYQAIARDGSGTILANQALPVKIDIQTSLTGGTLIYEELFSSITSNSYGLISLVVGTGTQTGGSAASFSAIDWKAQTLYLKTIIQYPGTTWTTMGTSQLWGVPYSLVAQNVAGPLTKLGITGTTTDMEEALFEVKNQAGNTVFAVYNEGIRAYVGNGNAKGAKGGFSVGGYDATKGTTIYDLLTLSTDSARLYFDSNPTLKGKKGGFSVGGYDMTKGSNLQSYLDVSGDSVRIYVDNASTKGKKGGFAVGGYDATKDVNIRNLLTVNDDSVRIYVNSIPSKGKKGGFSVGGYDATKGTVTPFTSLTPENYFIGHSSGIHNTTGIHNSFVGYEAGMANTTGSKNVFLGYHAGLSNDTASYNVFIGNEAGYINNFGRYNAFLGYQSGYLNKTGSGNLFLGYQSGYNNQSGSFNSFVGYKSGYLNTTGISNSFIGSYSGANNFYWLLFRKFKYKRKRKQFHWYL
jgi:hypothetical protein